MFLLISGGDGSHTKIVPASALDDEFIGLHYWPASECPPEERVAMLAALHDDDNWGRAPRRYRMQYEDGYVEVIQLDAAPQPAPADKPDKPCEYPACLGKTCTVAGDGLPERCEIYAGVRREVVNAQPATVAERSTDGAATARVSLGAAKPAEADPDTGRCGSQDVAAGVTPRPSTPFTAELSGDEFAAYVHPLARVGVFTLSTDGGTQVGHSVAAGRPEPEKVASPPSTPSELSDAECDAIARAEWKLAGQVPMPRFARALVRAGYQRAGEDAKELREALGALRQIWFLDHNEREWASVEDVKSFAKNRWSRICAAIDKARGAP